MSLKSFAVAIVLAAALAQPALADRWLGFERKVVIAPVAPYAAPVWYPPYAAYSPYPYYAAPYPYAGYAVPVPYGANWRDNWYDATHTKVHGYSLP
jgi:hypothetical protein